MGEYDRPREVSGSAMILAFLSGAAVGAVAALLMAPQSGDESREQLKSYARRAGENLREANDMPGLSWTARQPAGDQWDRGRDGDSHRFGVELRRTVQPVCQKELFLPGSSQGISNLAIRDAHLRERVD